MATAFTRFLLNIPVKLYQNNVSSVRAINTASTCYAARKGTREKAKAKKVKIEVKKVGFIPHNQRGKKGFVNRQVKRHHDDASKAISSDDVYPIRYYKWPIYTPEDAINAHKETHHPTMYNQPDAYIVANIELNMEAVKKNRILESFQKIALLPHHFPRDEQRSVLAFVKTQELQKLVVDAGATLVGGTELVKKIQDGEVKLAEYDHVVAHPNIITDLVPIRGLLKRKFPNLRTGTLGPDLHTLVQKFSSGILYRAVKDDNQKAFGLIQVQVGRLNMDTKLIVENLVALLKDIDAGRPKREGMFIKRCYVVSPPSREKLNIDPFVYVNRMLTIKNETESDDEEEVAVAVTL